jgi:hypothetical protein
VINLRITEEQFNELYPDLVGWYDHFDLPPPVNLTAEEFEQEYLRSKLWRLNNVYTVINKDGEPVVFRMNLAQHIVYAATRQHPRIIILKSRQQGISTFWLVSYFDDAVFCPFLSIGLMAQGTDEASTLLERVKFMWDQLDADIKSMVGVQLEKDNAKAVSFNNNSNIFIRVSFRSTTLQRLHVSEYGKIANTYPIRAKEVRTGTLQALAKGNTGVIESTAEGRNDFKTMWDNAVLLECSGQQLSPKDFKPVFLSWLDDPDCLLDIPQTIDAEAAKYFEELEKNSGRTLTNQQRWFWVAQHRELGGDVHQEYPGTPEEAFTAARDGTYFSRAFTEHVVRQGRVTSGLYDPNLPVDIFFDLGSDDYTVMGFVQWYRGDYRIVHEYWNNGMGIGHYLNVAADTGWDIRDIVLPHDAKQRTTATSGAGLAKNTYDIAYEHLKAEKLKWGVRVLPRTGLLDGIEAVRRMLPNMYIDSTCTYLIDCMQNYSKEWDDKLQVWKKTPLHDEYSHGADMLRQVAMGVSESELSNSSSRAISGTRRSTGFDV